MLLMVAMVWQRCMGDDESNDQRLGQLERSDGGVACCGSDEAQKKGQTYGGEDCNGRVMPLWAERASHCQ